MVRSAKFFPALVSHALLLYGASNSYKLFLSLIIAFSPTARSPNSFSCNTNGFPRKYCKQKTYGTAKSFACNTYKKEGVDVPFPRTPHFAKGKRNQTFARSIAAGPSAISYPQSPFHASLHPYLITSILFP